MAGIPLHPERESCQPDEGIPNDDPALRVFSREGF